MGKPFLLITDHNSLMTLLQSSKGNACKPILLEWYIKVQLRILLLRHYKGSRLSLGERKSIDDEATICSTLCLPPLVLVPGQLSRETVSDPARKWVVHSCKLSDQRKQKFQRRPYHITMFEMNFNFGEISALEEEQGQWYQYLYNPYNEKYCNWYTRVIFG